ncbi:hypothetical protein VB712_05395 [Spirulina sp. CCNP1310]|uniref:hypothetical protein n=1 Tax=Spirulina sp. CCNP1310 TaxID=3110249 RepID=UPI002B1F7900|nr:hypothetical protein [Spirulina sp. CCNP1310]MEA5418654.1 hypothetical protein [Spirulina sp. CCNP1310]
MDNQQNLWKMVLSLGMVVALPVGMVVTALMGVIAVGDPTSAALLFVMSVVCTLGVSLVIWLPLCWLVGILTLLLLVGIYGVGKKAIGWHWPALERRLQQQPQDTAGQSPTTQALHRYISQAAAKGYSEDQIQRRLLKQGWTAAEIAAAQTLTQCDG